MENSSKKIKKIQQSKATNIGSGIDSKTAKKIEKANKVLEKQREKVEKATKTIDLLTNKYNGQGNIKNEKSKIKKVLKGILGFLGIGTAATAIALSSSNDNIDNDKNTKETTLEDTDNKNITQETTERITEKINEETEMSTSEVTTTIEEILTDEMQTEGYSTINYENQVQYDIEPETESIGDNYVPKADGDKINPVETIVNKGESNFEKNEINNKSEEKTNFKNELKTEKETEKRTEKKTGSKKQNKEEETTEKVVEESTVIKDAIEKDNKKYDIEISGDKEDVKDVEVETKKNGEVEKIEVGDGNVTISVGEYETTVVHDNGDIIPVNPFEEGLASQVITEEEKAKEITNSINIKINENGIDKKDISEKIDKYYEER